MEAWFEAVSLETASLATASLEKVARTVDQPPMLWPEPELQPKRSDRLKAAAAIQLQSGRRSFRITHPVGVRRASAWSDPSYFGMAGALGFCRRLICRRLIYRPGSA